MAPGAGRSARSSRKLLGKEAGIYDWDDLLTGAKITNPAMLESETNICYVQDGWKIQMDGFGNVVLKKGKL